MLGWLAVATPSATPFVWGHGLWDVLRLAHGCKSVPLGTLCDTMRWVCWLFVGRPGWAAGGRDAIGDTIRLGRSEAVTQTGRSGGTMICGMSCILHTGAGLCRSGRSAIPCGGYADCSWADRAGLPVVGTPSATPSVWVGVGQLHRWGAPAAPWSVGCLASFTRVQVSAARDALRYHAVGVLVVRGQTGLDCRRSGRLRRYRPSGSVCTRRCVGNFAL